MKDWGQEVDSIHVIAAKWKIPVASRKNNYGSGKVLGGMLCRLSGITKLEHLAINLAELQYCIVRTHNNYSSSS